MVGAYSAVPVVLSSLPFVRACVLADAHDCGALPALPGEVDVLAVGPVTAPHPPPRYRGLVYGMVVLLPASWDVKTRGAERGTLPAVAGM